jgi:hypothetical protein
MTGPNGFSVLKDGRVQTPIYAKNVQKLGIATRSCENALTIAAILTLGAIATVVGSAFLFMAAPLAVLSLIVWLIRFSFRGARESMPTARAVVTQLWTGPGEAGGDLPGPKRS